MERQSHEDAYQLCAVGETIESHSPEDVECRKVIEHGNVNDHDVRTQILAKLRTVYASSPDPYVLHAPLRDKVVTYVIEICQDYGLKPPTWWHAIEYLDRYMATRSGLGKINRDEMEITVLACVLVASKFEEIRSPSIKSLNQLTSYKHSEKAIKQSEWRVFEALEYRLHVYVPHLFIERLVYARCRPVDGWQADIVLKHAYLFADIVLYDLMQFHYTPSSIGIACFYCALWNLGELEDELFGFEETLVWAMARYQVTGEATPKACEVHVKECAAELLRIFRVSDKDVIGEHIRKTIGWRRVAPEGGSDASVAVAQRSCASRKRVRGDAGWWLKAVEGKSAVKLAKTTVCVI